MNYNKIENFPLYLVNEISPNMENDDEYGLNTTGEGEAVILPNTIKPYTNDFIKINYMEEDFLFQVNRIEIDRLNGKKFYKLAYNICNFTVDDAEEKVTETYVTEYDNISTENNAIIKKTTYNLISEIEKVVEYLKKFYIDSFMNKKFKRLLYDYNDKRVYNEFLIRFIKDNNILENKEKKILNTYYIQEMFTNNPAKTRLYKNTLYYALEENDKNYFKYENLVTHEIQKQQCNDNPFALDYNEYFRLYYADNKQIEHLIEEMDNTYEKYKNRIEVSLSYDDIFGKQLSTAYSFPIEDTYQPKNKIRHIKIVPHKNEFVTNLNSNILYDDNEEYYLENFIIKYFNNSLFIDENLLYEVYKHNFYPVFKEYLLLPCIIFILKNKIIELTNK